MGKFYTTTPIYYVNDVPHIGHAYTTVAADTPSRYHRAMGDAVFFVTGTDEHGAKIADAAKASGRTPKEYADEISAAFRAAWQSLEVTNDYFVRTTDRRHEEAVQAFLQKLYDNGKIYKAKYEGHYCVGCEKFVTDDELVNGVCPDHLVPPTWHVEENYFFKLSEYQETLIKAITDESDPNHYEIGPVARRNEVLGKLRLGLSDTSISRAALTWGIPLPFDPSQTIYVWVDALLSYISAIGYGDDPQEFARWWPADLHLMAKDILWFHAILWPAMLLAAGERPPRSVFAHGFFTVNGQKMSKTVGNVIKPRELVDQFGADATRYLLLSEFPFGVDGDMSISSFIDRYNASLANDLGNLVNRTVSMINRYFGGEVPAPIDVEPQAQYPEDVSLVAVAREMVPRVAQSMNGVAFTEAFAAIWSLVTRANRYVEETTPWALAKTDRARLGTVLYYLAESIRLTAQTLWPVMPESTSKIAALLGSQLSIGGESSGPYSWGVLQPGTRVAPKPEILFPKIEVKK
jgi:methionyl-tRNA synthetase